MKKINLVRYECEICQELYDSEEVALKCEGFGKLAEEFLKQYKDCSGVMFKFNVDNERTTRIVAVKSILSKKDRNCESSLQLESAESNDYYNASWLLNRFETLSVAEAVAQGWRPFRIHLLAKSENLFREYEAAIRSLSFDDIVRQAMWGTQHSI